MTAPQRRQLPWQEPMAVARLLAAEHGETGLIWLDGGGSFQFPLVALAVIE